MFKKDPISIDVFLDFACLVWGAEWEKISKFIYFFFQLLTLFILTSSSHYMIS